MINKTMKIVEKKVYTNKELRDTLESLNLNDDTIDLIEINLEIKKWATYESGVIYVDLEYKGYKYEIHGYLSEKRIQELFYHDDDDESEIKVLNNIGLFLEKIQDKEIGVLEKYLDFSVIGESEKWSPNNTLNEHLEAVKWIDETPNTIKDEFEKNFKDNDYEDVLYDYDDIEYDGDSGVFYDEYNNFSTIYFNINSKGIKYEIVWINKN